jgi:hypothetical protein
MEAARSRLFRRYESRPGCLTVVTATLDELHGPTSGVVELPNRLLWRADRRVDLDDPWSREWMYAVVLRESRNRDDLRAWLDADLLRRLWQDLNLPRGVRLAWQDRHPELHRHELAA